MSAWTHDAGHLSGRALIMEPVERIRGEDRVDGSGGKPGCLGYSFKSSRRRRGLRQKPPHLPIWLDREDFRKDVDEDACQFAGARPEFEHAMTRYANRNGRGPDRPSGLIFTRGTPESIST